MGIQKINNYEMIQVGEYPANKVPWQPSRHDAVLLIHDMQTYFTDAYQQDQPLYRQVVTNISKIKQYCHQQKIPIIYSAQPAGQSHEQRGLLLDFWGDGIPAGTNKEQIIDLLKPAADDFVITKWRYSAFENTELEMLLQKLGKTQIIITGIYAHIGCMSTALAASMKNIKPFVIADAMGDFSREKHLMALTYISQLTGVVMTTAQLLAQ